MTGLHPPFLDVLFPMMMWDQGTRDPGTDWPNAIAQLMKEIDADGINGDTQWGGHSGTHRQPIRSDTRSPSSLNMIPTMKGWPGT